MCRLSDKEAPPAPEQRDVTVRTFVDGGEPVAQEMARRGRPAPGEPVPEAALMHGREGEVWLRRRMDLDRARHHHAARHTGQAGDEAGSSAAPGGLWHVYVDETEIARVPGHRLSVP